jgi:hypothetical protein
MKRSFKVATVFTGAACTAVLAPAAHAAPLAPGATAKITPADTTANNCTAAEAKWVHLYYTAAEHHSTPACFGGDGSYYLGNNRRFTELCAGNNSGRVYFHSISPATGEPNYYSAPFGEKVNSYWLSLFSDIVSAVSITGQYHNGNSTC